MVHSKMAGKAAAWAVLACAAHAWGQFTFDTFGIIPVRDSLTSVNIGPADSVYGTYSVSLDWLAVIGEPWSNEARFALASSPDAADPELIVYKFIDHPNLGRADNGANSPDSVRLTWSGRMATEYTGGDVWFIATQTLGGSQALWTNITVTFDEFVPPPAPESQDLGVLMAQGDPLAMDTFGSEFDTELALYDSEGTLIVFNDDAPFGPSGGPSEIVLNEGLAAGVYYVALTGYRAVFAEGFEVDTDTPQGSEGGLYDLTINGVAVHGDHPAGSVSWFRFEVVPAPSTFAAFAMGGVFVGRRRRQV